MSQLRQGDVLLEKVAELPAGLEPIARENGKIVLAHGEATGHAHAVVNRVAKFFQQPTTGKRFLHIQKPAVLTHQEHATIDLEPGVYEVKRQREYSPEAIRNVAD